MKNSFVVKAHEIPQLIKEMRETELQNLNREKLMLEIQDLTNKVKDFKRGRNNAYIVAITALIAAICAVVTLILK